MTGLFVLAVGIGTLCASVITISLINKVYNLVGIDAQSANKMDDLSPEQTVPFGIWAVIIPYSVLLSGLILSIFTEALFIIGVGLGMVVPLSTLIGFALIVKAQRAARERSGEQADHQKRKKAERWCVFIVSGMLVLPLLVIPIGLFLL